MNKNRLLPALIAVVIVVIGWFMFGPKPSDSDQIKNALESALKASKEGRPGGVVEFLAGDVVVNGNHYDVNRQFTSFIRRFHPDITVGAVNPDINGDSATVTSDIQFTVFNKTVSLPGVTFTFKRVHETKWLVFPSDDWKITGAGAPESGYQQIINDLAFEGSFAS